MRLPTGWGLNTHNPSVNCLNPRPGKHLWNFGLHSTNDNTNSLYSKIFDIYATELQTGQTLTNISTPQNNYPTVSQFAQLPDQILLRIEEPALHTLHVYMRVFLPSKNESDHQHP